MLCGYICVEVELLSSEADSKIVRGWQMISQVLVIWLMALEDEFEMIFVHNFYVEKGTQAGLASFLILCQAYANFIFFFSSAGKHYLLLK